MGAGMPAAARSEEIDDRHQRHRRLLRPLRRGHQRRPVSDLRAAARRSPIYYNEKYDFWALSRHSDVERALANWEAFSNKRSDILELVQSKFDMPGGVMMFQDPPEHTRLRGLMSRVFTPAGWPPSRTRSGSTAFGAWTHSSGPADSTSSPSWRR